MTDELDADLVADPAEAPARLSVLTPRVREALGDPDLTVREWRAGADFWADLVDTMGLSLIHI